MISHGISNLCYPKLTIYLPVLCVYFKCILLIIMKLLNTFNYTLKLHDEFLNGHSETVSMINMTRSTFSFKNLNVSLMNLCKHYLYEYVELGSLCGVSVKTLKCLYELTCTYIDTYNLNNIYYVIILCDLLNTTSHDIYVNFHCSLELDVSFSYEACYPHSSCPPYRTPVSTTGYTVFMCIISQSVSLLHFFLDVEAFKSNKSVLHYIAWYIHALYIYFFK